MIVTWGCLQEEVHLAGKLRPVSGKRSGVGVSEKGCRTADRAKALHHSKVALSLHQTTTQQQVSE